MTLSANRSTPTRPTSGTRHYPIDTGAARIWPGALVVLASGLAKPGSSATGLLAVGRARSVESWRFNADSGPPVPGVAPANGTDISFVEVEEGEHGWAQTGTTITPANVGDIAYVADDATVTLDASSKSPAGVISYVDMRGVVFVETRLALSRALVKAGA